MKKKFAAFLLLTIVAISTIIPVAASAGSGEKWNYGYDKKKMQDYNDYYHWLYRHNSSITKKGINYPGRIAQPRYWSKLRLDYTGPYKVTYHKHVYNK
ncbi:lactococcin 972 family bacteriocin [Bacillus inaquosorum]|uniref:lactococcin 972 family bacteriocin n=1 Tax=Bacillus inaquosorum TaxID=483913 RepID=UPI00228303ED|nr:lactococcin 972 family bacteriocin [Bacillus inaquosorum]MCY9099742.1 lactococcin 972 family bacteriocin [Bacillus inaquosorum]